MSRESKAHFGFPGYAHGTIAMNFTWMEREFNACQSIAACMYPSIFNRFPVIEPENSKVRHFSTFCTFWPPLYGYAPETIAVIVTWIEVWEVCSFPEMGNGKQVLPLQLQCLKRGIAFAS